MKLMQFERTKRLQLCSYSPSGASALICSSDWTATSVSFTKQVIDLARSSWPIIVGGNIHIAWRFSCQPFNCSMPSRKRQAGEEQEDAFPFLSRDRCWWLWPVLHMCFPDSTCLQIRATLVRSLELSSWIKLLMVCFCREEWSWEQGAGGLW